MWHDALRVISKPTFDPLLPVCVTFIGKPSVDKRAVSSTLALMKMSEDATIFQGPPECQFVHNIQGLQKNIFIAGLFLGGKWWTRLGMFGQNYTQLSLPWVTEWKNFLLRGDTT